MHISWQHPGTGEPIQGALAFGPVARELLARLLDNPGLAAGLRLVLTEDCLVLLGHAEVLPWVDGIHYLNTASEAAQLWLPSTQRPVQALDLVWLALQARGLSAPVLLWPEPQCCLSLADAVPWSECDPAVLAGFARVSREAQPGKPDAANPTPPTQHPVEPHE